MAYTVWHMFYSLCPRREIQDLTLHSSVNFCLSCDWLPAPPGYLQSMFSPSNSFALSSVIADWMNFALFCSSDTISLNLENI